MSFKNMGITPYANLHMHSTHSDGVYTPEELVKIAKEEGYKVLAITDHDTATAYGELQEACRKEGMKCIFGVEFSVSEPYPFHIVGFEFDPGYPPMKAYLEKQSELQARNTFMCFDEAVKKGKITGVTWDEILEASKGISWLCNNHIWRVMLKKGLVEESGYMAWFDENFRDQRAVYDTEERYLNLYDIVKLIKDAGGIAICAHPAKEGLDRIDVLLEAGIDGLEILHPKMSDEDIERAYKLCMENNLFISGGSDHCGLCGGHYHSYQNEEELKKSYHYIEPLTMGVYEKYFNELKTRKMSGERREL